MGVDLTPPPTDGWADSSAANDPLIGTELGNFRIEARIAEGGMGVIYRAIHSVIGRRAAIKVLTQKYSSDRSMIKRLHREAQAVNRIGHPNIVDIFDFGKTSDNREYFVMEYLPGQNLAELLEQAPRLPWSTTEPIIRQLLDALAAAHHFGIIHRDVKPENIHIVPQEDGELLTKVLDFGIAKSVGLGPIGEQLTRAGSVMGTPEYIAPEQIRGKQIDGRADLYAVGVILFEMLMGHRPFASNKVITLLMAHLREPVPAINYSAELGVPDNIPDVIRKAMAKDPEERFANAQSFGRALGFELSQVSADAGTRPLPDLSPEDPMLSAPDHGRGPRQPMITGPGAGAMPTALTAPPVRRRSALRWFAPIAILTLSLAAIGTKLYLNSRADQAPQATQGLATPPPADAGPVKAKHPPKALTFKPVDNLPALLTKVRRILRRNMQGADPQIRRAAVRATGKLRDSDAHAMLVSVLKEDPEPSVRSAAALALVDVGDPGTLKILRQIRSHNSELARIGIDEALMRLGQQDGRAGLLAALKSRSKPVRVSAALALAGAGDRRALPVMLEVVSKVELTEQPAVIAAMGMAAKLGHEKAQSSLAEGLRHDEKPLVQLGCAEALAQLGGEQALTTLRKLAGNKASRQTQLVAARLLASFGDYSALDALLRAVRAKEPKTRALAAAGLGAVADKSALPPLAEALDDNELSVRMAAAEALAQILALMPNQLIRRSQGWVFAALERGDWSMRHAAIDVTSEMDPELAVELLGWALRDSDARIRAAAVANIGRLRRKSKRAVKILTVALTDPSPVVRANAAKALGSIQGPEVGVARAALNPAVRDKDPKVGIAAAGAELALGDTRHLRDVLQATRLKNPRLRAAAIEAIGRWRSPRAMPHLVGALKDRSLPVRQAAALELARRGSKAGVPVLRKVALGGGARGHAALRALAKLGVSQASRLKLLARAQDPRSRVAALEVIELVQPKQAMALLRRGSRDPEVSVRRAAARGLARMAGKHPGSRGLLRQLTRDPDPAVRAAALVGLAKLPRKGTIDAGDKVKIAPAPLPEGRKAPLKQLKRGAANQPLFVEDDGKIDRYKRHMVRAESLMRRGRFTRALAQLRAARRALDRPPALCDLGVVHIKIAVKLLRTNRARARRHVAAAKTNFARYLRRAPGGKLAGKARAGLRDVKRLSRLLAP